MRNFTEEPGFYFKADHSEDAIILEARFLLALAYGQVNRIDDVLSIIFPRANNKTTPPQILEKWDKINIVALDLEGIYSSTK